MSVTEVELDPLDPDELKVLEEWTRQVWSLPRIHDLMKDPALHLLFQMASDYGWREARKEFGLADVEKP